MIRELHARLDRIRRGEAAGEAGMALVYVLIVTMLVTGAVTALLISATAAIVPTRQSQNASAAYAAAEAGLQDALAYLNQNAACQPYTAACTTPANATNTRTGADVLTGTSESFSWRLVGRVGNGTQSYLRVSATGRAGSSAKALVADVQGNPNVLDYAYYSIYETNGSQDIAAQYPHPRTIRLDCSSVQLPSSSSGTLRFPCPSGTQEDVTWKGAAGTAPSVCDNLWYDSDAFNGTDGSGRSTIESQEDLVAGADWSETASVAGATLPRDVPCQVAFASNQSINGGAYTVDAPLVSNQTPTGSGPTITSLRTAWDSTNSPAANPQRYRSDPYVGGRLSDGSYASSAPNPASMSDTFKPAAPSTACVYYGPTRVKLNGDGTATVTSPQTTSAQVTLGTGCYTPTSPATAGRFTLDYTKYGGGVIYVKDNNKPASGFVTTGQKTTSTAAASNTAFYLTSAPPADAPDTSTDVPESWTQAGANPQTWSAYSSTKKCGAVSRNTDTPNGPKPWDEQTFQCDWFGRMGDNTFLPPTAPDDGYTTYQQALAGDLSKTTAINLTGNAGNTISYSINNETAQSKSIDCSSSANTNFVPASANPDQLVCLLQYDLSPANSDHNDANWAHPSQTGYTHQYIVSDYAQNTSTQHNVTVGPSPSLDVGGDPFFDTATQAGAASTEDITTASTTFNIASQVYGCYEYNVSNGQLTTPTGTMDIRGDSCTAASASGKWAWGDGYHPGASSPQFQLTVAQRTYSNFKQGTTAAAYFPSMQDVTQYRTGTAGANGPNGPGDVYLDGINSAPLSVLADGDAVLTGDLQDKPGSSAATLIDVLGNVRLYHPVRCADTTAADINHTAAGLCPNDLTGLYKGGLTSGSGLDPHHPAKQYANLAIGPTQVDAALVAQGTNRSTGSIETDNAQRGNGLGTLTINGGMYQRHRGALGTQWEYLSGPRFTSGYGELEVNYQDVQSAGLGYVPSFQTQQVTHYWKLLSVSSPSGSAP